MFPNKLPAVSGLSFGERAEGQAVRTVSEWDVPNVEPRAVVDATQHSLLGEHISDLLQDFDTHLSGLAVVVHY